MARPLKGDKPLTHKLNLMVDLETKRAIDELSLARSKPGEMVAPSDVAREALDIGIYAMKNDVDPRSGNAPAGRKPGDPIEIELSVSKPRNRKKL